MIVDDVIPCLIAIASGYIIGSVIVIFAFVRWGKHLFNFFDKLFDRYWS
jgi:hypothetical protein